MNNALVNITFTAIEGVVYAAADRAAHNTRALAVPTHLLGGFYADTVNRNGVEAQMSYELWALWVSSLVDALG